MVSVHEIEEKNQSAIEITNLIKNLDPLDPEYVLIAKDLSKQYKTKKDRKALDKFYLGVKKGQIYGLLGPNGAGKTTFLKILTGIEKTDTGEAYIGGIDIQKRDGDNINVGFCPQFDILWPMLTVTEHLIFFSKFKGIDGNNVDSNVKETILGVNLEEDCTKLASQLSGGMKRRLSLAISLTGSPEIVFLDEPSSG